MTKNQSTLSRDAPISNGRRILYSHHSKLMRLKGGELECWVNELKSFGRLRRFKNAIWYGVMDVAIIEKEALQLPDSQRALLADRLIESLTPMTSKLRQTWLHEVDSRMDAFQSGSIEAVDGPQAMAELRTRFRK